ncbi:MAG: branched-chain amino acid ABC transporter permease [Candidatus Zixiibacteriota bacterium]
MMSGIPNSRWLFIAFVLISLAVTFVEDSINPYFFQVIIYVGINIILASSLSLINGFAGQFSLGHAGFMAIGAYTSAYVSSLIVTSTDGFAATALFPLILLSGGVMASLFGLLVGFPSFRVKGDYLAITTLGFGEIIRVVIQNLDFLGGARGFTSIPRISNTFWVFSTVALVVFVISNIVRSTWGKGFLAISEDEISAEAMGINSARYKMTAFATGAFFAGIAGALYAHFVTYINPSQFGFIRSIEIVVMVIVGGMHNIAGVVIAAVVLTILPEALRPIAEYRMVIYSLMLVVIMLTRPQGIFGTTRAFTDWRRKLLASFGAKGKA